MPVTIRRSYRDVLRRQVIAELTGVGDVYLALDADQWGTALTLRRRYEDCMRLLDDLGWRETDPGEEFAITMDPVPLTRVLARLHERASEALELHIEEAMGGQEIVDATVTLAICGDVLVGLAGDGVRDAMAAYREARDSERERRSS